MRAADATGAMEAPRIFEPEYYKRMRELESGSWWNAGMREVAASLLRVADLPQRGLLLDVGCGSGQTMGWFAREHPQWRHVGLDVAVEGLIAAHHLGITTVTHASALQLPIGSETVDLVITLDVLQHLPLDGGDHRALSEIHRVLRPGGYVFIRTNAQSYPHVADDHTFEFHKYRTAELRDKLAQAGLRVIRLGRLNALLGLAEIPRELRARRDHPERSYHGILAQPRSERRWSANVKRAWLQLEGQAVRRGADLPLGRTIVALCRKRAGH
jgi:ubiquinone/menaquinone biosynthesis C-methylase UbiE